MINFCGLTFSGLSKDVVLEELQCLKFIVTANSEFIVKAKRDAEFAAVLNGNYTTFDGQIPFVLAKLLNRGRYFEKISGSDLIYDFCHMAGVRKKKVFLLGGYEESNRLAVAALRERYNIEISGYSPPYRDFPFDLEHNASILREIAEFSPDILFVGFGAVKQELWVVSNRDFLERQGVKWAVGCGGTFEFVAGSLKRAPRWVQNMGLEGVYRFAVEPKWFRLKRLLISLMIFKYI